MEYTINIQPKATPRPRVKNIVKNGKKINLTYYPKDYVDYKNKVCLMIKALNIPTKDYTKLYVRFGMPYPKTVVGGKKEKIEAKPHKKRPDTSNLLKGFEDFLNDCGVLLIDDSSLYFVQASKVYTNTEGYITFMLEE